MVGRPLEGMVSMAVPRQSLYNWFSHSLVRIITVARFRSLAWDSKHANVCSKLAFQSIMAFSTETAKTNPK